MENDNNNTSHNISKIIAIVTLVFIICILALIANVMIHNSRKKNDTTATNSDAVATNTDTASESDTEHVLDISDYNNAISSQFNNTDSSKTSFTINAYVTDSATKYDNSNWMMTLAHTPEALHINDAYYADVWLVDNKIYYYDKNESKWFKSDYKTDGTEETEIIQTFDAIKEQSFPNSAVISKATINNNTYDSVTYTDDENVESVYYFKDMKLVSASSKSDNGNYIFITIDLNDFDIPQEVLKATDGNYEDYMMSLSNTESTEATTENAND